MFATVHLRDWWWLPDVFGAANVLALAGVAVSVWQLARQLRARAKFKITDNADGTASVMFRNRLQLPAIDFAHVWAVPKREATKAHDPPAGSEQNPRVNAHYNAWTPIGTITVPRRPYVVIGQNQANARIYSNPMRRLALGRIAAWRRRKIAEGRSQAARAADQ